MVIAFILSERLNGRSSTAGSGSNSRLMMWLKSNDRKSTRLRVGMDVCRALFKEATTALPFGELFQMAVHLSVGRCAFRDFDQKENGDMFARLVVMGMGLLNIRD